MSLSASLNNALTGLGLSSRRAEIIASNVANADTPGYARRRLAAGGPVTGIPSGRVQISRDVDPALQFLRRDAQSRSADAAVAQSFHSRIDTAIGDPDQPGSLQNLLSRLDAAFTSAATDPTSATRLDVVSRSARDLTHKLNDLADTITAERQSAEGQIGDTVNRLNRDLNSVARLNVDILRLQATGTDPSNLLDQRQLLVDRIAADIPIRELPRENGTVAIVSQGGIILLDGRPAEIGFVARPLIQPTMSYPDQLSGLTVNGRDVGTGALGDGLAGGGLGGLLLLRDEAAPRAMERLDALATELGVRFQDPTVDPSLAAGQPGLFTDSGAAVDLATTVGLAGRISINSSLDPGQASAWLLRDGLGATIPGPVSSAAQLLRFSDAFQASATPSASGLGTDANDLAGLGSRLRSAFSLERVTADDAAQFATAQSETLSDLRDGGKVDVDEEMRRLIDVEQAYAANARLVQAVGQMMDKLTEI